MEFLVSPTRLLIRDDRVCGLEFIRNELREADGSGRARPFPYRVPRPKSKPIRSSWPSDNRWTSPLWSMTRKSRAWP